MKQAKVSSQWKVPLCVPTRLVEKLARKFPERFGNRAWFQILVRNRALDPSMAGKREDKWSTTKPLTSSWVYARLKRRRFIGLSFVKTMSFSCLSLFPTICVFFEKFNRICMRILIDLHGNIDPRFRSIKNKLLTS